MSYNGWGLLPLFLVLHMRASHHDMVKVLLLLKLKCTLSTIIEQGGGFRLMLMRS
jgi:hypothetical protein